MISDKINDSIAYIHAQGISSADIGIVLGTGLSGLEDILEDTIFINYQDIPHFPKSTVVGHNSRMIHGKYAGKSIIMMSGRFHFYEGYSMDDITYYIHILKALGIHSLIMTNASGGINPSLTEGEVVMVKDHINLFPLNPLRGWHDDSLGPRFPDLTKAYPIEMRQKVKSLLPDTKEVVYLGWQGPSLETPAEYKMAQIVGADIVGMSSIPEVIIAKYRGIPVLLLSIVSNVVDFDSEKEASIEDIMLVMHNSGLALKKLISDYLLLP